MNARLLSLNVIKISAEPSTRTSRWSLLKELAHKRANQNREVDLPEGFLWMPYTRVMGRCVGLGNEDEVNCPMIVIRQQLIPR